MKIDVSNLTHEPGMEMPIEWVVDASDFASANPHAEFEGNLKLDARLRHTEQGKFKLDGTLTVPYRATCDRCLENIHRVVKAEVSELFVPERSKAGLDNTARRLATESKRIDPAWFDSNDYGDETLDWEEDETFMYRGHSIDLTDAIGQLMILAMPNQNLCKEDCEGLCLHCGQNKNKGSCSCNEPEGESDSPFADLKKLL